MFSLRSQLLHFLQPKRVKIDGLGTFFTTIENEAGGAQKKEDFNVGKNLKALHIRFIPEGEQELNISSREFIKKAEFVNVDTLKGEKKEETPSNGSGSGSGSSSQSGNQGGNTGGGSYTPGNPDDDEPGGSDH